ncbi:hypothetical protein PAXRUDRAFT_19547 [Paxillus rubicundulus Ve08.2h10]|uniref:Uncharacterized protein n=1 Tax=Paxillus rubicundulus Ve08.2h10 TaxID=930991 RepID=A0A0D0D466_9AGAM|nr:hypothetical protein PAXRUDRAFT_19547 [Paxillus rubicundulus Ve08.2h10]
MTVNEDIEAMPQRSSSLPLMTPSPVQGSSALPPASANDAKNDGMDLQGLPPQAIADYLWPDFQPGDLQFLQSEFDFATRAKINIHREKM